MNYITPVKHKLDGFKYYTKNIEEFFQQREIHLKDLIKASIEKGEDPYTWWADDYWLKTETSLMRMSLFLSLYAFLEIILNELCLFEQVEREISLTPSNIVGKGIERSKIYLTKVVGIDFPSESAEWGKIRNYQKLRNHLAHKGLRLTSEDSQYNLLIQLMKQHPELYHRGLQISDTKLALSPQEIEEIKNYKPNKRQQLQYEGFLGSGLPNSIEYDNIEIKAGFCEGVIEDIDSFWKQLIKIVENTA